MGGSDSTFTEILEHNCNECNPFKKFQWSPKREVHVLQTPQTLTLALALHPKGRQTPTASQPIMENKVRWESNELYFREDSGRRAMFFLWSPFLQSTFTESHSFLFHLSRTCPGGIFLPVFPVSSPNQDTSIVPLLDLCESKVEYLSPYRASFAYIFASSRPDFAARARARDLHFVRR